MPGTRKLGKTTEQRLAMHRQQVTDFLDKGRMETTVTRAKEIRPIAEKMITLGKKNTLASRRDALAFITREDVVTKIFAEIAPKYASRHGGYCRITRLGPRRGDSAEMAVIELVEEGAAVEKTRRISPVAAPITATKPTAAEEAAAEAVEEVEAVLEAVEEVEAIEEAVEEAEEIVEAAEEAEAIEEAVEEAEAEAEKE